MIIIYVTLTAFVTNCTVTTTELVMNVNCHCTKTLAVTTAALVINCIDYQSIGSKLFCDYHSIGVCN